jgi:hypothetical protein
MAAGRPARTVEPSCRMEQPVGKGGLRALALAASSSTSGWRSMSERMIPSRRPSLGVVQRCTRPPPNYPGACRRKSYASGTVRTRPPWRTDPFERAEYESSLYNRQHQRVPRCRRLPPHLVLYSVDDPTARDTHRPDTDRLCTSSYRSRQRRAVGNEDSAPGSTSVTVLVYQSSYKTVYHE